MWRCIRQRTQRRPRRYGVLPRRRGRLDQHQRADRPHGAYHRRRSADPRLSLRCRHGLRQLPGRTQSRRRQLVAKLSRAGIGHQRHHRRRLGTLLRGLHDERKRHIRQSRWPRRSDCPIGTSTDRDRQPYLARHRPGRHPGRRRAADCRRHRASLCSRRHNPARNGRNRYQR